MVGSPSYSLSHAFEIFLEVLLWSFHASCSWWLHALSVPTSNSLSPPPLPSFLYFPSVLFRGSLLTILNQEVKPAWFIALFCINTVKPYASCSFLQSKNGLQNSACVFRQTDFPQGILKNGKNRQVIISHD